MWLKSHKFWKDNKINSQNRPAIEKNNIIAAIPPPAEIDIRNKIGEGLKEKDKTLLSKTLILLKDISELGFLLKAEIEIPKLIKIYFKITVSYLWRKIKQNGIQQPQD